MAEVWSNIHNYVHIQLVQLNSRDKNNGSGNSLLAKIDLPRLIGKSKL